MASKKLRTLHLMNLLLKNTDEAHRLTGAQIVAALIEQGVAAERKAIYRDIAMLQEYGLDIKASNTGYYIASRSFSVAELRVLLSAVQAATFVSPKRTAELCEKIRTLSSAYQARSELATPSIGGVKCQREDVFATIEQVNCAISLPSQLSFLYYKLNARLNQVQQRQGKRYVVSPYAMIWLQDRYYLVANLSGRDDLTHFRLDRMRSVRVEPLTWRDFSEVSPYKGVFDIPDYVVKCVNMFAGEAVYVELCCSNSIVNEIADRFGEKLSIIAFDAERFTARVKSVAGNGLLSWISQFGAQIEILSPASLRETMRQRLVEMSALYRP